MFADELPDLLSLFGHEAEFAQFLKPAHGFGIVAGMFIARPQAGGLVVVGFIHFQRKIVPNQNELAKNLVVAREPRAHYESSGKHAQSRASKLPALTGQAILNPT